jgi:DNA mismatch endonuclease Vsr
MHVGYGNSSLAEALILGRSDASLTGRLVSRMLGLRGSNSWQSVMQVYGMPSSGRFGAVPEARRRNMAAIRAAHTKPELTVRRLLHAMGYRFRLHRRDLPGRPDLVFPSRGKVIEVRGCFWHHHSDPACRNAVLPATRREWWAAKLEANVARDARNLEALHDLGWGVMVVWECEAKDTAAIARRLRVFLGPTGPEARAAFNGKRR